MDFVAQSDGSDAERWAADREAEGWHGVSTQDHTWSAYDQGTTHHLFVTLARFAAATTRVRISAAFANNLIRSPVEFAHASLTLNEASGGRYVAGLGAGWEESEVRGFGFDYPAAPGRARRFREAVQIARELLHGRPCRFPGEFYDVDVPALGPRSDPPPPLVAAVAGDWTCRHLAPLVDRVELAIPGPANPLRTGRMDVSGMGRFSERDVRHAIDLVREANGTVPISATLFVAAGPEPEVGPIRPMVAGGLFENLVGEPAQVAETIHRFAELGITGATILPWSARTLDRLAPALLR